jgi:hypothetical protein
MAAPTNVLQREESSCQPGAVRTWHKEDTLIAARNGVKRTLPETVGMSAYEITAKLDRLKRFGHHGPPEIRVLDVSIGSRERRR